MPPTTMHPEEIQLVMPSSAPKTRECKAMRAWHVLWVRHELVAMMLQGLTHRAMPSPAPKIKGFRAMRVQHVLLVQQMWPVMMHPVLTPPAQLATKTTRCRAMLVHHAQLERQMPLGIMLLELTPNAIQSIAEKTKRC
jgi:hypothetical protein